MYFLNTKIRLTMLCLSGFELFSTSDTNDFVNAKSHARKKPARLWLITLY